MSAFSAAADIRADFGFGPDEPSSISVLVLTRPNLRIPAQDAMCASHPFFLSFLRYRSSLPGWEEYRIVKGRPSVGNVRKTSFASSLVSLRFKESFCEEAVLLSPRRQHA